MSFQSTLPARGATRWRGVACVAGNISIHAPRTGSDAKLYKLGRKGNISIHAPRTGSDQLYELGMLSPTQFQSTLPARGATNRYAEQVRHLAKFQSTLPARGATYSRRTLSFWTAHFNPRSPHGERRATRRSKSQSQRISIHAPRTGSDCGILA